MLNGKKLQLHGLYIFWIQRNNQMDSFNFILLWGLF
jgi:hypothetical protein